jgi:hypothetical protein
MADESEISNMDGFNIDRLTKGSNGANQQDKIKRLDDREGS